MKLSARIKMNIKKSGTVRKRIAVSYLSVIIVGTFLFASGLPMKDGHSISIIDAFFTSTSAFADCGLSVIDNTNLNLFGHIITLILLEFGGIGVMAFKIMFLIFLGQKINISDRLLISTEQNQNTMAGMIQLLKVSIIIFFTSQILFAIFFTLNLYFAHNFNLVESLGYGIYHSISTINSAGYDIIPETFAIFKTDYLWQIMVMFGLFIGGIGFPTLYELYIKHKRKKEKKIFRHSLYFKINVVTYFIIFFIGLIAVLLAERNGILAAFPDEKGFFYILFQTFSYRSAGFQTIGLESFSDASQFIFTLLMFIGVGPASTGGGIRTTVLGVIFICFIAFMQGKENVNAFNRRLTRKTIINSFMVMSFATILVGVATTSILLQTKDFNIFQAFFEAISAFGTIGTSYGVTEDLNIFNKVLIALLMIIGRLGIIGAMLLFTSKKYDDSLIKYPEENITIG